MSSSEQNLVGTVLANRYQVLGKIGSGGMGVIYEALQLGLGRPVAIKVLTGLGDRDRARFRVEAMSAAGLAHPNIVQIVELETEGDIPFLVMERLYGLSLQELLLRERVLDAPRIVRIGVQILAALDAAHRASILHRDIKPANVFLVEGAGVRDFVKLLDFGIAKVDGHPSEVQTTAGTVLGTLSYMAPERLIGAPSDGRADLYAVGLCLREMLTGMRSITGSGTDLVAAILRGVPRIDWGAGGAAASHRELGAVIDCATALEPGARFSSASEMRAALERCTATSASSSMTAPSSFAQAPHPPSAPKVSGAPGRAGLVIGLVLVSVVALAGLAFAAYTMGEKHAGAGASASAPAPKGPDASTPSAAATATASTTAARAPSRPGATLPPVNAKPGATASATAPVRNDCFCVPLLSERSGNTTCNPAQVSRPPMCRCESVRNGSILCGVKLDARGDCPQQRRPGSPGAACTGIAVLDGPVEQGKFGLCGHCAGSTKTFQGPSGGSCSAVSDDLGTVVRGVVDCR